MKRKTTSISAPVDEVGITMSMYWLADGQGVPESLEVISPKDLVGIVPGIEHDGAASILKALFANPTLVPRGVEFSRAGETLVKLWVLPNSVDWLAEVELVN